ncbi:MAG: serine hydrolase, partial [Acidobacteriota bacterium]|nr:serine hydrolase [Acidobacteriota bacterium]
MIEDVRFGKPDYNMMSAGLAAATRQQLSQLQPTITQLGAIQSVTFKGVGPGGADIYRVNFESGSLEYRISLT